VTTPPRPGAGGGLRAAGPWACTLGVWNVKTAVETIFVGKDRAIQAPLPANGHPRLRIDHHHRHGARQDRTITGRGDLTPVIRVLAPRGDELAVDRPPAASR